MNNAIFDAIILINGSYNESICKFVSDHDGDRLPYIWCSDQIRDAVSSFADGDCKSIDGLVKLADGLLHHSDHSVREFASIGLIEDMQNGNIVPIHVQEYIASRLSASAKVAWDDVMKFWNREIPFVPDRG